VEQFLAGQTAYFPAELWITTPPNLETRTQISGNVIMELTKRKTLKTKQKLLLRPCAMGALKPFST
jgi:hypothetical protein